MIKALTEETKHPAAVMLGRLGGLKTSPRKRRAQRKNLEKGRRVLARKRKAAKLAKLAEQLTS